MSRFPIPISILFFGCLVMYRHHVYLSTNAVCEEQEQQQHDSGYDNRRGIPASQDPFFQSEVASHTGPVLVCFGAKWCDVTQESLAALESFGRSEACKVKIVYIDMDLSPDLIAHYRIERHSMFLFVNGAVVEHTIFSRPAWALQGWIDGAMLHIKNRSGT